MFEEFMKNVRWWTNTETIEEKIERAISEYRPDILPPENKLIGYVTMEHLERVVDAKLCFCSDISDFATNNVKLFKALFNAYSNTPSANKEDIAKLLHKVCGVLFETEISEYNDDNMSYNYAKVITAISKIDLIYERNGQTPLHAAIKNQKSNVVAVFLHKIINTSAQAQALSATDDKGNTPVHYLFELNDKYCTRLMLDCIANLDEETRLLILNHRNQDGDTVLDKAFAAKNNFAIKRIVGMGGDGRIDEYISTVVPRCLANELLVKDSDAYTLGARVNEPSFKTEFITACQEYEQYYEGLLQALKFYRGFSENKTSYQDFVIQMNTILAAGQISIPEGIEELEPELRRYLAGSKEDRQGLGTTQRKFLESFTKLRMELYDHIDDLSTSQAKQKYTELLQNHCDAASELIAGMRENSWQAAEESNQQAEALSPTP